MSPRRFPHASVRVKTTAGALAIVTVALLAAGAGLLEVTRHGLVASAERTATIRAQAVARAAADGTLTQRLAIPEGEDSLLQVVADDGRILAASHNLTAQPPIAAFEPAPDHPTAARDIRANTDGQDHLYRLVAVRTTAYGTPATVYAGTSLETAEHAERLIRHSMIPGIPVLLALVGAVTWTATARALRPVEAIRAEVAEITEHDLGRRVPVPASRDEIARLSVTVNDTLDRLEHSMDRQRRFVADASHELRNPIAALRAHVELAIAHPELLDGPDLLGDVLRVQELADDLLLLARLDAGQRSDRVTLDLTVLTADTLRARPNGRVPVTFDAPAPIPVRGNRNQLARILENLLDNAQRHAESRITVTASTIGDTAVLEVCDDGSGIPEPDRDRVFTRFTRLDESRSRDAGGTGLGLAIARDIATAHHGTLTAREPRSRGARLVLTLPSDCVTQGA
ncbi:sensor histidine kinase [Nocardia concava]|uniref:sensor histidine kinase n=1 Tax=Nocardia concava TaxID=257281 RepID=UPI0002D76015|nr:HAMP domain-containing sensor histidine kinase [Nocardia concava]